MSEWLMGQLALIAVLGVGAQWLAWRLKLPAILLLLLVGLTVGPGAASLGVGRLLDPDRALGELLPAGVALAVALILFEGGLSLRLEEVTESTGAARNLFSLVAIGGLVTWGLATLAAHWCLGLGWPLATLLGAILVVTGPTVILPLLREVRPAGRIGPILKWEGIVIDPIGASLAVLVAEFITSGHDPGTGLFVALRGAAWTLVAGGLIGLAAAALIVAGFKKFWVPDYLHTPVTLAAALGAFAASDRLQPDSGLLAVTAMGLILANQRYVVIRHIAEFKETLTILLVSALFVILSSRLTPAQLASAGPGSLLFTAALILVVRPASVIVSTLGQGLTWSERAFLMAMAPRGIVAAAVASVFALRLGEAGIEGAGELVPAVFTAIVGTVTVYGLGARWVARYLGLARAKAGFLIAGANPVAMAIGRALKAEGLPLLLVDTRADQNAPPAAGGAGLPVLKASILSPFVRERVDPGLLGGLLALTPSEEVNSLAAIHFASLFGREHVFQLTPEREPEVTLADAAREHKDHARSKVGASSTSGEAKAEAAAVVEDEPAPRRAIARELHGRVLFGPEATYERLERMIRKGATVDRLPAGPGESPLERLRQIHGDDALPLFLVDEAGEVRPVTLDIAASGAQGRTLLALVPPVHGY